MLILFRFLLIILPYSSILASDYQNPGESIFPKPNVQPSEIEKTLKKIILSTKKITLKPYINGNNPSILPYKEGYLLSFRHTPSMQAPWMSHICVVKLSKSLKRLSYPQLIPTPIPNRLAPSQTQDVRLFKYKDKIYAFYNDSPDISNPQSNQRRDMYVSELSCSDNYFSLTSPTKLIYPKKYEFQLWQKNWSAFEWNQQLLLSYSIIPHEVVEPNLTTGVCLENSVTHSSSTWAWGEIRGGTPALKINDEYLAFFHSSIDVTKPGSKETVKYYYLGAYTFSDQPPFPIIKITPYPLVGDNFYTHSERSTHVIFPGGFVDCGSYFLLAYGKNDSEIHLAKIHKQKLLKFLKPL